MSSEIWNGDNGDRNGYYLTRRVIGDSPKPDNPRYAAT
jgi:hypothetical protein